MLNRFRFCYFGEVFVLLHLAGVLHCSWWWAALFYLVDMGEGLDYRKQLKMVAGGSK